MSRPLPNRINIFAIITSLAGKKGMGGAINEMQLLSTLSSYAKNIYIACLESPETVNELSNLIILKFPKLTNVFRGILHSSFFAFMLFILKVLGHVDVVYVRSAPVALIPVILRRFVGPIVVKIADLAHDVFPLNSNFGVKIIGFINSLIEHCVVLKADLICVHSDLMAKEITKRYGVPLKKCIVVPPGIKCDIERIRKIACDKSWDEIKIGYLGRINYWQGIDILFRAMEKLYKKYPNVSLWIVGDGPMMKEVKSVARKASFKCVLTGAVSHEDALKFLSTFHMLVIPRRRNPVTEANLPMKLIEALALSVPVIVTDNNIIRQTLEDEVDVLYTNPLPNDVFEKMSRLIEDKALHEKLRNRGPELAKMFDSGETAKKLYNSLIKVAMKL